MEKEDQPRKLNFLDLTIINTGAGKYEFKIHQKNAITNVQIKPYLYVNPALVAFSKGLYPEQRRYAPKNILMTN